MSQKPKSTKSSKVAKNPTRHTPKPKSKSEAQSINANANPDNPYRAGTMYATLFELGSQNYIAKDALIAKVAEITKKPLRSVSFGFDVLKARNHKSNSGRSALLVDDAGLVKFVALKK